MPRMWKSIKYPHIRTPQACVTQALVYCVECDIKGTITAQLSDIKKGVFKPVTPSHKWQQDPK
ncbi:hypothetical protein [Avibacterium avium]|uniref:hypothetical protein n=1 Tax=Avibacterium avium TaxID=751 RepID=UPI003BF8FBA3